MTRYLEAAVADRGVDVRLGVTANPALLRQLAPEVIVVATGSEPNLPNQRSDGASQARMLGRQVLPAVPGLEQPFVVSCDEVLSGAAKLSGKVLVIDNNGHWEAAGTAEYLADLGCSVEVVASHSLIGEDIEAGTRTLFYRRAAIKGIRLRSNTVLLEVGDHRAKVAPTFSSRNAKGWDKYILVPGEGEWIDNVDWLVPIISRRSREDLFLELKTLSEFGDIRIERVGDCVAPRLIQSIIAEAFALAQTL